MLICWYVFSTDLSTVQNGCQPRLWWYYYLWPSTKLIQLSVVLVHSYLLIKVVICGKYKNLNKIIKI